MADQKLITLKINDRDVQVPVGTTVIEATRLIGTEVPSFCYYPGLSLQGACRMCVVKVEKMPKLQTACTTVVAEGMIVSTDIDEVRRVDDALEHRARPLGITDHFLRVDPHVAQRDFRRAQPILGGVAAPRDPWRRGVYEKQAEAAFFTPAACGAREHDQLLRAIAVEHETFLAVEHPSRPVLQRGRRLRRVCARTPV